MRRSWSQTCEPRDSCACSASREHDLAPTERTRCVVRRLSRIPRAFSSALRGCVISRFFTQGLRRGLHSWRRFAAVPMLLRRNEAARSSHGIRTELWVKDGL